MNDLQNNKGFSLVELIIAMAIGTLVAAAIASLIVYSTRSMKNTHTKIQIQQEAKDIMNHITNVAMEGSSAVVETHSGFTVLIVRNATAPDLDRKEVYYWVSNNKIFFGSSTQISLASLAADDNYLLGNMVLSFLPSVTQNQVSKRFFVKISLEMKKDEETYKASNQVYLRNQ